MSGNSEMKRVSTFSGRNAQDHHAREGHVMYRDGVLVDAQYVLLCVRGYVSYVWEVPFSDIQ